MASHPVPSRFAGWKVDDSLQRKYVSRTLAGRQVYEILREKYPNATSSIYRADTSYSPMDYAKMQSIWRSSNLEKYRWKEEKFDCDDFAVCFKATVAQWCYHNIPDQEAYLCGVMFATSNNWRKEGHAFNFTLDANKTVILFEPQNGSMIQPNEYNPYFCMF